MKTVSCFRDERSYGDCHGDHTPGMSADEFRCRSQLKWLKTTQSIPHFKHLYMELVSISLNLELLEVSSRANGFKTFIVSGGGVAIYTS